MILGRFFYFLLIFLTNVSLETELTDFLTKAVATGAPENSHLMVKQYGFVLIHCMLLR